METPEIARTPPWIEQNNRAMLIIFRACESSQQDIIDDQLDAFSTWKKLQEVYQSRDAASVQRLYNEFTNLRPTPRGRARSRSRDRLPPYHGRGVSCTHCGRNNHARTPDQLTLLEPTHQVLAVKRLLRHELVSWFVSIMTATSSQSYCCFHHYPGYHGKCPLGCER